MKNLSRSVVINAPLRTVYNQWTRFEEYHRFLGGECMVRQLDVTRVAWRARIWGLRVRWRTNIYEQVPDRYIAWRSSPGEAHEGSVIFEAIDGDTTRVFLTVYFKAHGILAKVWTALGAMEWHMGRFLHRFRLFVESHSSAATGWRGSIHDGVPDLHLGSAPCSGQV